MSLMFFISFVFFMKYERFVYVLIGIEFLFFVLLVEYVYFFESMMFFYFLCFGIISSVVGLVLFFFVVKEFGFDKVMFCF
uniref:NADH dehydrogenase subunit 4L n=1 Tax=Neofoleyellides sp. XM-2022 TaxID=3014012 RepID=A0A9E9FZJ4_9BILA|nr:NADH dehydrogenase subunit 4L [Neofoleyellides sp. XM-2022]